MHFVPLALVSAAAVSASPVARTLAQPLQYVSYVTSMKNIVAKGQDRLNKINGNAGVFAIDVASGAVTNEDVTYVAPVIIGGKTYQLIVDTGSSNTWCGASSKCEPSSTGKATGGTVQVSYGSGSFSGKEYTDTVSFAGLSVTQSIGSATSSTGFEGVDGIIGFGPVDLTEGTVSNVNEVPTFTDNLLSQGKISTEVLGVSFRPEPGSSTDSTNGELTLGGTDSSKYSGSITYFPKLTSGTASAYWGISITKFAYGSTSLATGATGIVDTGTTLIYIPTSAYNKFLSATGGTTDEESGLASFKTAPTQNFVIEFGSTSFTLTPSQYLVPTAQYSEFELSSGKSYAFISDGGSSGVDTIIGQKFIEQYYAVFDTTNSRIGFAPGV